MLRIFRSTSPMSIGSWTLAFFGTSTGLAAIGQLLADLFRVESPRAFARVVGIPAAIAGMLMSVYTGVLLSATSTPLWSVAYRHLPALFGATASASAAAALSLVLTLLGAPTAVLHRLDRLALVAGASQLVVTVSTDRLWEREGLSMHANRRRAVLALGTIAPVIVHSVAVATGRRSRMLGCLVALATLAGAFFERADIVFTGNESADSPADYLRIAGAARE
jgi:formate-dependent nitrite reductase membrane component NrfD